MAETGGQMVSFSEPTPKEGTRGPVTEAAPFIAQVERLMIRVRSAKLRDHDQMLENLQAWVDRAMSGGLDVGRDGESVIGTLSQNVQEMIRSRTLMRRVVSPMAGLAALGAVVWGLTVWAVASDILFLNTPVQITMAAVVYGLAGSAFWVLLRTITFQYELTDRTALFFTGLARPVLGGVLALAVFSVFGAGIVSLPIVSDQETTTPIGFLAGLGGQGVLAGQLAMFAFAFAAGILEGAFMPVAGRGVSRLAARLSRGNEE